MAMKCGMESTLASENPSPTMGTRQADVHLVAKMLQDHGFDEKRASQVAAILVEYEHRARRERRRLLRVARLQLATLVVATITAGRWLFSSYIGVIDSRLWL